MAWKKRKANINYNKKPSDETYIIIDFHKLTGNAWRNEICTIFNIRYNSCNYLVYYLLRLLCVQHCEFEFATKLFAESPLHQGTQRQRCCCCLPYITIVVSGNWLLKIFKPMVVKSESPGSETLVMRTQSYVEVPLQSSSQTDGWNSSMYLIVS